LLAASDGACRINVESLSIQIQSFPECWAVVSLFVDPNTVVPRMLGRCVLVASVGVLTLLRAICRLELAGSALAVVAALLSAVTALPQAQHDALIDFYDATNGLYWYISHGWLEFPEPWYFTLLCMMLSCRPSCCLHRPCRESTWGRGLHCRRCVVIAARGLVWIARPTTPPSPV
jgi:hypothetical protein